MQIQLFELQPFARHTSSSIVQVKGKLRRSPQHLTISYLLLDPQNEIVIPAQNSTPVRQDDLWTTTCLELFFGPVDSDTYWEVNLSIAGHWNVYRFDAYRSGMREERAFRSLPFAVERQGSELHLQLDLALEPLGLTEERLEVAIATVLQSQNNQISYWALTHPGSEADFHRRDSFILTV